MFPLLTLSRRFFVGLGFKNETTGPGIFDVDFEQVML